jgi:hypothetical protein
MTSLIQMSALLLNAPDDDPRVENYANQLLRYTQRGGKKASVIRALINTLSDEVIPMRNQLGEEGFREIMAEARGKVREVGGVTGYLGEKKG